MLLKKTHGWGARKLHRLLRKQVTASELPCRSTVFDILKRHGLVKSRRRRQKWQHPGAAPLHTDAPERGVDDRLQGPVQDSRRRVLLSTDSPRQLQPLPARLPCVVRREDGGGKSHRRAGLPRASACRRRFAATTGSPFASTGIHGLCALNVWWMKLGIVHQRITPSSPQENGAHERMHRTLKAKATRPPAASLRGQQWKFDTLPARVQLRASSRSPRRRIARIALDSVVASLSSSHRSARVPRSLRAPSRQQRRPVQDGRAASLHQPRAQGRPHRSRGDRRRPLEHRLLQHAPRPPQRAHRQDQRGFVPLGRVLTMSPDTCKGSSRLLKRAG